MDKCKACGMAKSGEHEAYGCMVNSKGLVKQLLEALKPSHEFVETVAEWDVPWYLDIHEIIERNKAAIAAAEGE